MSAESWDDVDTVRTWLVSIVTFESAPDVFRLAVVIDLAERGDEMEMPSCAARLIKPSRYASKPSSGSCRTSFRNSCSGKSGELTETGAAPMSSGAIGMDKETVMAELETDLLSGWSLLGEGALLRSLCLCTHSLSDISLRPGALRRVCLARTLDKRTESRPADCCGGGGQGEVEMPGKSYAVRARVWQCAVR